jgi:ribosomal protein S18 acetylase RimI-like enzyme
MTSDGFSTRPWIADDVAFLWDMLYLSIHVPAGSMPPSRSVLEAPDIAHYLRDFGSGRGDDAQIASADDGRRIAAAFCRCQPATDPGYGFVAEEIPEVGMAVVDGWRGRGVGRALLTELLGRHPVMSLSVDADNDGARSLYESIGFVVLHRDGTAFTMLYGTKT